MKIFVTGAAGFVGRYVVRQIQSPKNKFLFLIRKKQDAGYFTKKNETVLVGDLNDCAKIGPAIKDFNPDVCIHLAWQGIPDYSAPISKMNLTQSIDLLDFLAQETSCKKMIISGSCFEYGRTHGVCEESKEVKTNSYFSWAKQSLYRYASLLCAQKNIELIWFRFFYVYGPGQRRKALIPTLIDSFKNKTAPPVNNPFNANDFVFVEDVARAFALALKKSIPPGIYNLGTGKASRVVDICRIVEKKIFGASPLTQHLRKKFQRTQTVNFRADIAKAQKNLGWRAQTDIKEGINRTIASLEEQ